MTVVSLTATLSSAHAGPPSDAEGFLLPENPPSYVGRFHAEGAKLALGVDGALLVADVDNERIVRYSSTGQLLTSWSTRQPGDGNWVCPVDVAQGRGGAVYVVDSCRDRVQVFSSTGAILRSWGRSGSRPGRFDEPHGIALDAAGHVVVLDSGNDRIQVFTRRGRQVHTWGRRGSGAGSLRDPLGLAVGPDGTIHVADTGNARVQVFAPDGRRLRGWGGLGSSLGRFERPYDLFVDGAGDVFVADTGNGRIQKFDRSGRLRTLWGRGRATPGPGIIPYGIAVDAEGGVYAIHLPLDEIRRYRPVPLPDLRVATSPDGIFRAGNLYVPRPRVGQRVSASALPGGTVSYRVVVQNDAPVPDRVVLDAHGSSEGFSVTYEVGGTDVTGALVAGTFTTPELQPSEELSIRVEVTVSDAAALGEALSDVITAVSETGTGRMDSVGHVTRQTCTAPCVPEPTAWVVTRDGREAHADSALAAIGLLSQESSPMHWIPDRAFGIAATPDRRTVYIASLLGFLTPVDVATSQPGTPISIPHGGWDLAITADGRTAYVTNAGIENRSFLTPVDLESGRSGEAIPLGRFPSGVAITPDGSSALVASRLARVVTPVDLASGRPGTPIPVPFPDDIVMTPDGSTAFVSGGLNGEYFVVPIDLANHTVGERILVAGGVSALAMTPDGATIIATGDRTGMVTPIDVVSRTARPSISVGDGSVRDVAVTPDGRTAYVTLDGADLLVPIDLATGEVGTGVAVGDAPRAIALTP